MTKPGGSLTKKTLHELAREFPNKTYRELEKYRDADRNEEAQRIITQKETQARCNQLQDELDRIKKENNDLHNKVAKLTDPAIKIQKARESGF